VLDFLDFLVKKTEPVVKPVKNSPGRKRNSSLTGKAVLLTCRKTIPL
jgi:hypothetical protein